VRDTVDPNLETYFAEIHHEVMDRREELALAREIVRARSAGDDAACLAVRDRMACANLRLVVSVAKYFTGRGLEMADLVQEGNIGLLRAIERFDPELGNRFSTLAVWWIRQSVARAIDDRGATIRVPLQSAAQIRRLRAVRRDIAERTGEAPTVAELAGKLEMSELAVTRRLDAAEVSCSLDDRIGDDAELTFADVLVARDQASPEDDARRSGARAIVLSLVSELSERESDVIRSRFGFGCDPETLEEIGSRLGVTRERVRQLEQRALARLRHPSRVAAAREALRAIA
jgi:RNA polymerase sigma factor (sigma-70 family)